MAELVVNPENKIGQGRWRVGHYTLDEVVETIRSEDMPLTETLIHLARLTWRKEHPNPRPQNDKISQKQTASDLKAGEAVGALRQSYDGKWSVVLSALMLPEE